MKQNPEREKKLAWKKRCETTRVFQIKDVDRSGSDSFYYCHTPLDATVEQIMIESAKIATDEVKRRREKAIGFLRMAPPELRNRLKVVELTPQKRDDDGELIKNSYTKRGGLKFWLTRKYLKMHFEGGGKKEVWNYYPGDIINLGKEDKEECKTCDFCSVDKWIRDGSPTCVKIHKPTGGFFDVSGYVKSSGAPDWCPLNRIDGRGQMNSEPTTEQVSVDDVVVVSGKIDGC